MERDDRFNGDYWSGRYQSANTPWDIGYPSTPLTAFFQGLYNKSASILIPGAGNAYEAEWLWANGFKNCTVVDLAQEPLDQLRSRVSDIAAGNLVKADFFDLEPGFDLIVEQTFFCALAPEQRPDYVKKMSDLLRPGGQLVGVLFDFPLTEKGPPFGGDMHEYRNLFEQYFKVAKLERCYNSIKPRQGSELFFRLIK